MRWSCASSASGRAGLEGGERKGGGVGTGRRGLCAPQAQARRGRRRRRLGFLLCGGRRRGAVTHAQGRRFGGGGGQQRVEKKRPRNRRCTTMKKKNNEMMTIRRRTQTTAPTASDATPARLSLSLSNHYYTPSPTLYLSLCPLLLSQDGRRCSNCTGRTTFCIIHAFCFQLAPCSCGRNACHAHHHALLNK